MNFQRIEIINEELGIGACEGEDIPHSLKQQMPLNQITVLYWYERDWLILNKSNPDYQKYKEMLTIYLQMDGLKRKEFKDFASEQKVTFFNFVNQVLRIRRKWYKTKVA